MKIELYDAKGWKEERVCLTEVEDSPCGPEGFELELGCEELG